MRSVALKTLEGQVTKYVSLAQRGETVLITDQDHVIAELTPHRETRRDPLVDNAALAEAVRVGWITPAEIVSDEPPPGCPSPLSEICSWSWTRTGQIVDLR
jgi:antitoxin (DNA-binding transcriptional repressor) of toxin-antitoxin stability system